MDITVEVIIEMLTYIGKSRGGDGDDNQDDSQDGYGGDNQDDSRGGYRGNNWYV